MLNRNIRDNVWALSKLNLMILVHFLSSVKIATTALQCYWRESAALGWSWSTTPSRATGRDLTELLQILILSSHLTSSNTHSCPCMLQLEYPPSQHDVCWWWKLYFLAPASVGMSEKFMTWDKWKCSFEFSPQHGDLYYFLHPFTPRTSACVLLVEPPPEGGSALYISAASPFLTTFALNHCRSRHISAENIIKISNFISNNISNEGTNKGFQPREKHHDKEALFRCQWQFI